MNQLPSSKALPSSPQSRSTLAFNGEQIGSTIEQQRWEREIFFKPSLVEAERSRSNSQGLRAVFLAMLVGCLSVSTVTASNLESTDGNVSGSSEESLSDWLWDLVLDSDDQQSDTTSKNGEDLDPEEGDPK